MSEWLGPAFVPASPMRGRSINSPRNYGPVTPVGITPRPPKWIKPQLTRLVDEAPAGDGWLHEIKYDGYRMHARIDGRDIKLLTRTGLDWSTATGARSRRLAP